METNKIEILKAALLQGVVDITFEKKDGTLREMKATLSPTLVPVVEKKTETVKPVNDAVMSVYDVEAQGWRSFIVENLKSYAIE